MKPERAFVAERMLARHCPELLRAGPAPIEPLPALERLGQPLARALAAAIAPLCGGDAPGVHAGQPREGTAAELGETVPPLAANTLFAIGPSTLPLLASIDGEAVLRIVDRTFGGSGAAPAIMPAAFPLSAELTIARLEGMIATALSGIFGPAGDDAQPMRRDGSLAILAPFAEDERLAIMAFAIEQPARAPWSITLAMPLASLAQLLGPQAATAEARPERAPAPDCLAEPYADLPVTLSAVLVDMRVPVSTLSALQPGQVIPVAVARSVPLQAGDRTIAHGTIGALDDRVAVQVTQAF